MAYLPQFGDSAPTKADWWRQWLPGTCALCRQSAQGWSLCQYCHDLVVGSRQAACIRCSRCDIGLQAAHANQEAALCPECSDFEPVFAQVVTVFDYEAPMDLLIHEFKVRHRFTLAPVLAMMLCHAWAQRNGQASSPTLLTAVPASRSALMRRGFNPAMELARYVSRQTGWHFAPGLLARTRSGQKQASLGRMARRQAAMGLYRVTTPVVGHRVLVVDDVVTTGSTLDGIARTLHTNGAESVSGLALARTPLGRQGLQ